MQIKLNKTKRKELVFQIIVFLLTLLYVSQDNHHHGFNQEDFYFLCNYFLGFWIISYYLLPKFFYKKRYIAFVIGIIVIFLFMVIVEEFFLEQIFYPDTRGLKFFGFSYNILETIPIVTLLVGLKFAWDAHQKQYELEKINKLKKETELNLLKSQINPHFLFNNLNNLYAYALENSPKTPDMILKLSDLLRYMLYDCKEKYVPLYDELTYIKNYIQLHEMQIEDRGTITYVEEGNFSHQLIAPQILIVFIENSFKHSSSSMSQGIQIQIKISVENNQIHLLCTNTYTTQNNTESIKCGIGLENVKSSLELLYPKKHKLTMTQKDQHYTVDLLIDLK